MDAVKQWLKETFPEIIREAEKQDAVVYFEDETSIRQNVMSGKTWALKGQTPVIHRSGQRCGYTIAGAIGINGKFWHQTYEGGMNSERYLEFLKGLMKKEKKRIILIHDGLPAHKSLKVKEFLNRNSKKIQCRQLPGYSPDLNPIEMLWSMLKKFLGSRIQKSREKLKEQALNYFENIPTFHELIIRLIEKVYPQLSTLCMNQ